MLLLLAKNVRVFSKTIPFRWNDGMLALWKTIYPLIRFAAHPQFFKILENPTAAV
jgi:hypothetical protein